MTATAVETLQNFVGGRWVDSRCAEWLDSRAPASGELLARVPLSTAADVADAVSAARGAVPAWSSTPVLDRARALMELRALLDEARDELAALVSLDMGKTYADARAEVGRGIESVEAALAAPHLLQGGGLEQVADGIDTAVTHHPVGVVGAITPFNFPAMIPLWFLPFALVCGNTVVLKPSEQDPLASQHIVSLIASLESVPPGVVNLVHGGREAVGALLDDPGVDAISFVGSASTARLVASRASASGKRVQALGGAKNAMIAMPDADPGVLRAQVAGSSFGAAGQRCLAGSVLVAVGSPEAQDATVAHVCEAAASVGDACPLVSSSARERVVAGIERAAGDGARILVDGRCDAGPGGCELGPTVLEVADDESHAAREELFGPVLAIVRRPTLEDAIAWANGSRYGNSAILFTTSGAAARTFRRTIEAGMLGVNVGVAAPVAWFPFAGWKDSFDGMLHANGADAFRFYTRVKVTTTRW